MPRLFFPGDSWDLDLLQNSLSLTQAWGPSCEIKLSPPFLCYATAAFCILLSWNLTLPSLIAILVPPQTELRAQGSLPTLSQD